MSFWGELKRRNVYKVGVAYAIVAWLIVQAAAIVFPHLDFPEWTVPFVIVLLIIGFPLILLFAWAFEVTPEGIKRTKKLPLPESSIPRIGHGTGKSVPVTTETKLVVPVKGETEKVQKTIAVLPFLNLSSDPEQEYFVDGLSEEILNSLCQIHDLAVIARTSSFSFKGTNKTIQEIATVLGVDNILEGSVRKAGNALRITAQLVKAVNGSHLWSKCYDRELKDIFAVQEDIATAVANELKVTLGVGKSFQRLGGTDNVEAYELYLVAQGKMGITYSELISALESINAAIELDPKFALLWAMKAQVHLNLTANGPADRASSELDAALKASQKAIGLEPNLAEAYAVLGSYQQQKGNLIETELAFRSAFELTNEPLLSSLYVWLHYCEVGYFKKAHEYLETACRNDPLNQFLHSIYVSSLGLLGDIKQAEEEDKRCRALFGDKWNSAVWAISLVRLNSKDVVSRDEIPYSDLIYDIGKEHLDSPKEGLAEFRRIYSEEKNLSNARVIDIATWAAYLGDPEFAMAATERASRITATRNLNIWIPVMRKVRQLPRFKEFVREIGLVDYWNKFGWPDMCHKLDNGDFECN